MDDHIKNIIIIKGERGHTRPHTNYDPAMTPPLNSVGGQSYTTIIKR